MEKAIVELAIPNPLSRLGYREFEPANAKGAIAYSRSYKTFTVFAVKHHALLDKDAYMISFTFGKTEICLPNFYSFDWIEKLHNDQTNP